MSGENPYEQQAREKKVFRMVEFLRRIGVTSQDAEKELGKPLYWEMAADHLGVKPPSLETQKQIVAALLAGEVGDLNPKPEYRPLNWDDMKGRG